MTEVENQTLNLLKNIIENRDKIFESINEVKEKLIPIMKFQIVRYYIIFLK